MLYWASTKYSSLSITVTTCNLIFWNVLVSIDICRLNQGIKTNISAPHEMHSELTDRHAILELRALLPLCTYQLHVFSPMRSILPTVLKNKMIMALSKWCDLFKRVTTLCILAVGKRWNMDFTDWNPFKPKTRFWNAKEDLSYVMNHFKGRH